MAALAVAVKSEVGNGFDELERTETLLILKDFIDYFEGRMPLNYRVQALSRALPKAKEFLKSNSYLL